MNESNDEKNGESQSLREIIDGYKYTPNKILPDIFILIATWLFNMVGKNLHEHLSGIYLQ